MFEYRKFGDWVFVENIYKVREDIFTKWLEDEDLQNKILSFLNTKKDFLDSTEELNGNTQIRAFCPRICASLS